MFIERASLWTLAAALTAGCETAPADRPLAPVAADAAVEGPVERPIEVDVVRVRVDDRPLEFRGPAQVKPECFGEHKGFRASDGDDRLHLNVFILEPGTYQCNDPMSFGFIRWQGGGASAEYGVSPVEPVDGSCQLVVETVRPRMRASFSAQLDRTSGEGPDEVRLTEGEMDIALPRSCP